MFMNLAVTTASLYRFVTLGARQSLTNFYASTEEGELIVGDWAARGEEDRCGFQNSDGLRYHHDMMIRVLYMIS
jgi:hypothetical protein